MAANGAVLMYTNKYANCRTVKCYPGNWGGGVDYDSICNNLPIVMLAAGVTGYSVKRISRAIIVRLPLDF